MQSCEFCNNQGQKTGSCAYCGTVYYTAGVTFIYGRTEKESFGREIRISDKYLIVRSVSTGEMLGNTTVAAFGLVGALAASAIDSARQKMYAFYDLQEVERVIYPYKTNTLKKDTAFKFINKDGTDFVINFNLNGLFCGKVAKAFADALAKTRLRVVDGSQTTYPCCCMNPFVNKDTFGTRVSSSAATFVKMVTGHFVAPPINGAAAPQQPKQPVYQPKPAQPVQQPKPVQPVQQPQPVYQPKPVQPVQQPKPVQPVQQPQPVYQPKPQTQPAQPAYQPKPAQPVQPAQPAYQPQPVVQTPPVQPVIQTPSAPKAPAQPMFQTPAAQPEKPAFQVPTQQPEKPVFQVPTQQPEKPAFQVPPAPAWQIPQPEPAQAPQTAQPEKIICPSCATANDDDARFCKHCGVKLQAPQQPAAPSLDAWTSQW